MADTAVAKRSTLAPAMIQTMQGLMPHVPALLPADITTEQFRAALYLELSGRSGLNDCTAESLRDAVIKAATYGLLPGRDCHFLPFSNRRKGGKKEATFVPNYFGLILALERTGKIRRAFAHAVHQGDQWHFDVFQDRPVHVPAVTLGKEPGKELFYYGAVMFKDGTCAFEVLTLEDLEAIAKRAPGHENGPWVTDREMMCRKSCIKRVAKYVKLTPEQRGMLEQDEERERDDIPLERHRQNIVDLFGEGGNPTAYVAHLDTHAEHRQTYNVDPDTGELMGEDEETTQTTTDADTSETF
jgi:recombination protein RecT